MDERDPIELVVAFAVGAILGVGATLLLRQEPALPGRIAREVRRSGRTLKRGARRAEEVSGSLASAGREVLEHFRGEVADVVSAAREQLAEDVYAQLRGARQEARTRGRAWRSRKHR
jgi:hypothetical protein